MSYQSLRRSLSTATKLFRRSRKAALALQKQAVKAVQPVTAKPKPVRARPTKAKPESLAPKSAAYLRPAAARSPAVKDMNFKTCPFPTARGNRSYKLYGPDVAGPPVPRPLLIMLHGCSQSADDFARATGMNRQADDMGFIVAYPTQTQQANRNKCWNWYRPVDQGRGNTEPAMIVGMTRDIMAQHPVDRSRVYIAGFSAGGAAAVAIAAAYPGIYAAVGVHSGLPVGAARAGLSALVAMQAGSAGVQLSVPMPTIIFHGDDDAVVNPRNGRALAARAVATFPALTKTVKNGKSAGMFHKTTYRGPNRKSCCEYWTIAGAGHVWSGGNPAERFAQATGPDASAEMVRFFLQHRLAVAGID